MALSDALWHVADGEDALAQDHEIAELCSAPEDAVRAACLHAEHLGAEGAERESSTGSRGIEPLVHEIPPRARAAFLAMRAWCRTQAPRRRGGARGHDEAMRSDPDPRRWCVATSAARCSSRVAIPERRVRVGPRVHRSRAPGRARAVRDRRLGPLWAVARSRPGVRARQSIAFAPTSRGSGARGEYRIVAMLLLTLGEIHRAAGQLDEASTAYEEAAATGTSGAGSLRPAARMNLAVLGVLHGDPAAHPGRADRAHGRPGSALARSWVLLDRVADLLDGAAVPALDGEASRVGRAPGHGRRVPVPRDGAPPRERGASGEASAVLDRMRAAAREHQVDVNAADDLVRRFIALRPPKRLIEPRPA
jgi:hypothetical protein